MANVKFRQRIRGRKVEGYWKSQFEPNLPIPKENTFSPPLAALFAHKLQRLQDVICDELIAKGCSHCRICNCVNGNKEYLTKKWTWPEGLIHYVKDHYVKPSQEFINYIEDAFEKMEDCTYPNRKI